MILEPKEKNRISALADESVIINAFRDAAGWIYRRIRGGFIGTVLTSFGREENAFRQSLSGFGMRRVRGRNTFFKRTRRRVAGSFEDSFVLGMINRAVEYMLTSSLRLYGAFGIIFGIYTMLMFTIKVYALKIDTSINDLIIGGIIVLLTIPMLYVRGSIVRLVHKSRLLRTVYYSTLRIHEARFIQTQQRSGAKYNAAVISGMIVGFMTYFISPVSILIVFAVVFVAAVILYQPEAGVLALIIAAPFVSVLPRPTFILAAGVALTTVSCIIKYLRGKRTLKSGLIGAFVMLFAVVILFGGIVGVGGLESLKSAVMYAVLMLGYFLVVNLLRTRESCRHALKALTVSMVITSLYGIVQYLFGGLTANWLDTEMFSYIPGRATSFFDNPNILGSYLIMLMPMLFMMVIHAKGFKRQFLLVFAAFVSMLCLVWTWSRGAWLGFIVGTLIFFLIYSYRTIAFLLAGGLALPIVGALLPSELTGRFTSIGSMADSSTYYRVYTWKGVLRMLREVWHSGIGVGQAAFEQVYPVFAYAGTEVSPHAHNLIMQIVSEVGIAGLVTFIIVIFFFLQNCFEFIGSSRGEDRSIVAAGLAGVCSALFMGLFDHIWYNYRVFFVFWIVIALTNAYIASARSERAGVYDKMMPDTADITLYNL